MNHWMGLPYDGNLKGSTCRQVCPEGEVWEAGADNHQLLKWHGTLIPRQALSSKLFLHFYNSFFAALTVGAFLLAVGGWNEESQWSETEFVKNDPESLERVIHENEDKAGSEGVTAGQQKLVPTGPPILLPALTLSFAHSPGDGEVTRRWWRSWASEPERAGFDWTTFLLPSPHHQLTLNNRVASHGVFNFNFLIWETELVRPEQGMCTEL